MAKPISASHSRVPPIPCDRIPDSQQYIASIQKVFDHKTVEEMTRGQQQSYFSLLVWGLRDIQQSRLICSNSKHYITLLKTNTPPKN